MQRLILLSALVFLFIAGNPSFHVTLAAAQDAAVVNAKIVTVIFENDKVSVLRARYAPHQRLDMHSHPAKAEVQITDGRFRIFTPDAKSQDASGKAGEFFRFPPTPQHAVENPDDHPMELLEIEMKQATAPSASVSCSPSESAHNSDPGPVEREVYHRCVFQNQYVRVFDVKLAPGEATGFHTHSHDNIPVFVEDATIQQETFGEAEWKPASKVSAGEAWYVKGNPPYTHRTKNAGNTPFRVIDVELLQ